MPAQEGAKLAIGDIHDEPGMQVQAEINETDSESLDIDLDVTVESDWQNAVETAVSRFGKLDVLVQQRRHRQPQGRRRGRMTIEALPKDSGTW